VLAGQPAYRQRQEQRREPDRADRGADLGEHLKHTPVVQDDSANAGEFFPIIHTLFSNIKAWLVGTHHRVSTKHPRATCESGLTGSIAAICPTVWIDI